MASVIPGGLQRSQAALGTELPASSQQAWPEQPLATQHLERVVRPNAYLPTLLLVEAVESCFLVWVSIDE